MAHGLGAAAGHIGGLDDRARAHSEPGQRAHGGRSGQSAAGVAVGSLCPLLNSWREYGCTYELCTIECERPARSQRACGRRALRPRAYRIDATSPRVSVGPRRAPQSDRPPPPAPPVEPLHRDPRAQARTHPAIASGNGASLWSSRHADLHTLHRTWQTLVRTAARNGHRRRGQHTTHATRRNWARRTALVVKRNGVVATRESAIQQGSNVGEEPVCCPAARQPLQ